MKNAEERGILRIERETEGGEEGQEKGGEEGREEEEGGWRGKGGSS